MIRPVHVARLPLNRYQQLQHRLSTVLVLPAAQAGDQVNVYAESAEQGSVAIPFLVRDAVAEGGAVLCYVEPLWGYDPSVRGYF